MKHIRVFAAVLALLMALSFCLTSCGENTDTTEPTEKPGDDTAVQTPTETPILHYGFDETGASSTTVETVSGTDTKIYYVFNEENADNLFKEPSEALRKAGVKGNALYMDGFSTYLRNSDLNVPTKAFTLSAWVAPRVFENLAYYSGSSAAAGQPRLTSVIDWGDIEAGEGVLMGYGRLGLWGVQLALRNRDTYEEFVVSYYDPLNALPLYEWSHIAVSFDGDTGYIALAYNGQIAYEAIIPELVGTSVIPSGEPLYIGRYTPSNTQTEFAVNRQMIAGLLDEVSIYRSSLSPAALAGVYRECAVNGVHPALDFSEIALDSSVYEGDRYRPQYHAIPPATWMNEPHSPFYYNGKYHVMYQHNPAGPYWSQIRWGHLVSDDMVHWKAVKDAVVPTAGICPEGVWTGGACIGPDGTPWLAITAGTTQTSWSGQNIAFAHAKDPTDPYLTEWVVEETVVIAQPSDDSQGERDQFRDPFVWRDGDTYYLMVSTSVPGRGGSACIYTSANMHEWEYRGYLYECDFAAYPEQGAHWECVVMLPISTKDGKTTKYILFDCPQYTVDGYVVDCYYWIGTFDKENCRFIADNDKPQLFDLGRGVYTGQNGYCYLTDEDIAAGKTAYEAGRTILYAIAQGKDAGTAQNISAGWAHNFATVLELHLSDDGTQVIREPISELESLEREVLYDYSGEGITADTLNAGISEVRGDMLRIDATFTLSPTAPEYAAGIRVRYNPTTTALGTEHTDIIFGSSGVYVNRDETTMLTYVANQPSYTWDNTGREFSVTILLDRSMLEVYVNGVMSFTMRVYPKWGDSDFLSVFDQNAGVTFTSFRVVRMGSAYRDEVTPPYYGNVGNLKDQID